MPGSNSSRSNASRDRFRLRPAQLLPSEPQTERLQHIIPGPPSRGPCRHFPTEERSIVPLEGDDNTRLLQRQLECQRRRVEDMADVLRYSREERERLKNEILLVSSNLSDSHTLLDEHAAVKERLTNELTVCRRDLHHICLGVIDVGCNIPQVAEWKSDGGHHLILLDKAKKELSRMSGALQRTPIRHPAIVVGEVVEGILRRLLSSVMKGWRGFIRASNEGRNMTVKSFLLWRIYSTSRKAAKNTVASRFAYGLLHKRNAFYRWRLWRRYIREVLSMWTSQRLLRVQRQCLISWRTFVSSIRARREKYRKQISRIFISWRAVKSASEDIRCQYERILHSTLARRDNEEMLKLTFSIWWTTSRLQRRTVAAKRSVEVMRYIAVQSAFVQWRRCLVMAANRRTAALGAASVMEEHRLKRLRMAVCVLRDGHRRCDTNERIGKALALSAATHRKLSPAYRFDARVIFTFWRSEAQKTTEKLRWLLSQWRRGGGRVVRCSAEDRCRRFLIEWRHVTRVARAQRMVGKISVGLIHMKESVVGSCFNKWLASWKMRQKMQELLDGNLKRKYLLYWRLMTKLTVERLEVAGESKRLETEATMEKVLISWRAVICRSKHVLSCTIVLGRIVEKRITQCYWARGISALKEHKTAIQKRKTLERIRREIIVDGDRQSMRATFDLWHLVARRGARLSSIRRSGANRTVRTVVAAWRAETRCRAGERTRKDTLRLLKTRSHENIMRNVLVEWQRRMLTRKCWKEGMISMEVRRGNRLMSRVVAEWFEISMDTTAQHERSVEVSRKARLGHILATWLRVAHRNRLDRRNEEICRRYCRQQNSANLRRFLVVWRSHLIGLKETVRALQRVLNSRHTWVLMKWKMWMIQDKITNQIGEVLKRKKDTSRVALLQWKTWRQGRSIAAGRALMVDAILNRETYRLVNEVLYGWKCECLKSALLLRVAKELIHRREMVYLRKGFHGLKQEGTRLRFGCRRLCAAVSSALHRRGWWMLWELLLHSRDEAIQCYEVSRMKSLLRLSCRRTLRRYLIEWKNVVMKSHERLGRLKLILGEWTEDGIVRTCLKGWKNMLIYRRQELAKIELLSLMEKHVGMVERTKARKILYSSVISWRAVSHHKACLRKQQDICVAHFTSLRCGQAFRQWVKATGEVSRYKEGLKREQRSLLRSTVIAWFKISISAQRLRYHVEYLVRSRHITFLSAWRNIALTGRRTRIAGTTAGALSLQALVHRRLRAGMYCLRDGYNRSSKRSLLMLSVLSTISDKALMKEYFRRWALKITHSGDNDGKADSERRFILSSLMLKWRSLAHRRRFGFRLLTEALVRRQKKIISLAVYHWKESWHAICSDDRDERLLSHLSALRTRSISRAALLRWHHYSRFVRLSCEALVSSINSRLIKPQLNGAFRTVFSTRVVDLLVVQSTLERIASTADSSVLRYTFMAWRYLERDRDDRLKRSLYNAKRKLELKCFSQWWKATKRGKDLPCRALLGKLICGRDNYIIDKVLRVWRKRRCNLNRFVQLLALAQSKRCADAFSSWWGSVIHGTERLMASRRISRAIHLSVINRLRYSVSHWRAAARQHAGVDRLITKLPSAPVGLSSLTLAFKLWQSLARRTRSVLRILTSSRCKSDMWLKRAALSEWRNTRRRTAGGARALAAVVHRRLHLYWLSILQTHILLRDVHGYEETTKAEDGRLSLLAAFNWWAHQAALAHGRCRILRSTSARRLFRSTESSGVQHALERHTSILGEIHRSSVVSVSCRLREGLYRRLLEVKTFYAWLLNVCGCKMKSSTRLYKRAMCTLLAERNRMSTVGQCLRQWQRQSSAARAAQQSELLRGAASELQLLRKEVRAAAERARSSMSDEHTPW